MRYLEFPIAEMTQRKENAQESIRQKGLEGLLITAEANYYYFTGYRPHTSWSTFTRPAYLFIPKEQNPVLLVQLFVMPEAQSRSAIQDVRGFKEVVANPTKTVVEIMRELGMGKGQVGCELGHEQRLGISYAAFEDIKSECPGVSFVDAADILWKLRMVKLSSEIECLRKANQITSAALDTCFRQVQEGMSEYEVSRMISQLMLEMGADEPGFVIICSGKGNYERNSARATDRILREGDMLWLDVGALVKGYWSDFCRAGVVGAPSVEQRRLQAIIHEVTMAACQKIGPGLGVAEVAKECVAQMEVHGLQMNFDAGRAGHGIGLMSTEPPGVTDYDPTVLEPGMVITVEPALMNELGIFCIEENVLVTEAGCEIMSGASRDLYTISLV